MSFRPYMRGLLGSAAAVSAFDPDAAAYITAVETADGQTLEPGVKTAIDTFITGCKTDGNWAAIKSAAILAGARTLPGALVPLKGTAPTNVSSNFVSADYDRKTGLKGDGATKRLDTNYSASSDPQNSRHNAAYVTEVGSVSGQILLGDEENGSAGTVVNNLFIRPNIPDVQGRVNNISSDTFVSTVVPGLYAQSRSGSAGYDIVTPTTNGSISRTSQTPPTATLGVFNRTVVSVSGQWSDSRISFFSQGESIDGLALRSRVAQLMTDLDGAIA